MVKVSQDSPSNLPGKFFSGEQQSPIPFVIVKPRPHTPKPQTQIPNTKGPWADTKILWATTNPHPTPPITFRGPECGYMVQIDALSTPECQEGVPSHFRWTARGRTWGSPPSSRRTLKKKVLRV